MASVPTSSARRPAPVARQPLPGRRPPGRGRHVNRRHLVRQRILMTVALVAAAALAGGVVVLRNGWAGAEPLVSRLAGPAGTAGSGGASAVPADAPGAPAPAGSGPASAGVPQKGAGTFAFADGTGAVLGTAGTVRRFRVAVENGSGQAAAEFAALVEQVFGDQRGWTAGGQVRLQRVPKTSGSDFTVYLATPVTSESMCAAGGLHTDRYTSCRLPGQVILNLERWLTAVPDYGAGLDVYRAYAVNHEVGHELGHGHEACPGQGRPAPVMQQQTMGLKGCLANAWPYVNGQLYSGPAIP